MLQVLSLDLSVLPVSVRPEVFQVRNLSVFPAVLYNELQIPIQQALSQDRQPLHGATFCGSISTLSFRDSQKVL